MTSNFLKEYIEENKGIVDQTLIKRLESVVDSSVISLQKTDQPFNTSFKYVVNSVLPRSTLSITCNDHNLLYKFTVGVGGYNNVYKTSLKEKEKFIETTAYTVSGHFNKNTNNFYVKVKFREERIVFFKNSGKIFLQQNKGINRFKSYNLDSTSFFNCLYNYSFSNNKTDILKKIEVFKNSGIKISFPDVLKFNNSFWNTNLLLLEASLLSISNINIIKNAQRYHKKNKDYIQEMFKGTSFSDDFKIKFLTSFPKNKRLSLKKINTTLKKHSLKISPHPSYASTVIKDL